MRIYLPLSCSAKIGLITRSKTDEPQVQSELFHLLVNDGFYVRAGIPICKQASGTGVQFDLVIFKNRVARAIIEVKSGERGPTEDLDTTAQGQKYRCFGVPVVLFWDIEQYPKLKKFLDDQTVLEQESVPKKQTFNRGCLQRLYKSLDIASMSAYDVGMHELEAELEDRRDIIKKQLDSQ